MVIKSLEKELIKIETNDDVNVFVRPTNENKYIAFGITHGIKPKIIGLTVPCSKKELKELFGIRF